MIRALRKIVPSFIIDLYHFLWALGGAAFFGFPSRRIKVIGVTGTNGKTTTVDLVVSVLEEGGYEVAALSSERFKAGEEARKNEMRMTMPGRAAVQRFLRTAVDKGCQYAVLEVTSEGVAQHRHRFINFNTAVLTNLTPEHIESHGSFEAYRAAKGMFFDSVPGIHILNADDESLEYFSQFEAEKRITYGVHEGEVRAEEVETGRSGVGFKVRGVEFNASLLGRFNVYNSLAAVAVGLSEGMEPEKISEGLERVQGVPGRMEIIIDDPFTVIVDYAFTPNALEQVYRFLKTEVKDEGSDLICVLGACGGGRDKWKRSVLGTLAGQYCDKVIVTNEDPYDEDPMEIINQVAEGAGERAVKVERRREGIRRGLDSAREGDVVIITGKGSEPSIYLAGGEEVSWDDRKVAREEFNKIER